LLVQLKNILAWKETAQDIIKIKPFYTIVSDVVTILYVTKMWRMAIFIRHNCGERKNNVGYRCFIVSISSTFYTQVFHSAQLFSNYSLALYFFGVNNLDQKVLVKCWWNWLNSWLYIEYIIIILCCRLIRNFSNSKLDMDGLKLSNT
jgi:hypothetical protein